MSYTSTIPLTQEEHVVLDAQKHWFILTMQLVTVVFATIIPIVGLFFLTQFVPDVTYLILIAFLWILLMWVLIFRVITDYYLDVIRITNLRVLDVDQKGLFYRNIAAMRLAQIQDVTVDSSGVIATLLRYGTLKIQSAGEDTEFVIHHVANPEEVSTILMRGQNNEWTNQSKGSL